MLEYSTTEKKRRDESKYLFIKNNIPYKNKYPPSFCHGGWRSLLGSFSGATLDSTSMSSVRPADEAVAIRIKVEELLELASIDLIVASVFPRRLWNLPLEIMTNVLLVLGNISPQTPCHLFCKLCGETFWSRHVTRSLAVTESMERLPQCCSKFLHVIGAGFVHLGGGVQFSTMHHCSNKSLRHT